MVESSWPLCRKNIYCRWRKTKNMVDRNKPLPFNINLREYAKEMRKNPTPEEKKIWYSFLRYLKPNFHRQRIIGNYIVDFYCPKLNLVIEIDGWQHHTINKEYDDKRTEYLESLGFSVLRIDNQDVNYDYNYVACKIREVCKEKAKEFNVEFTDESPEKITLRNTLSLKLKLIH